MAGYTESHKLSSRVRQLEAALRFVEAARTEIRFSALPVQRLVQRHGGELPFLRQCAAACENGGSFAAAWSGALADRQGAFTKKDRELLLSFGEGLGASDLEGQLSHCELYTQLFTVQLNAAREERQRKSKLCLMLGISGGLSAALILC